MSRPSRDGQSKDVRLICTRQLASNLLHKTACQQTHNLVHVYRWQCCSGPDAMLVKLRFSSSKPWQRTQGSASW